MAATFGLYFKDMTQEEANAMRRQLNEVAAAHGYLARRGATAGQGNAAELLMAIANGEIATVLLADEPRSMAIRFLDEQAKQLERGDISLSQALKDIADQLYAAVCREADADEQEMRSYLDE